jgi:hypothetical protein
MAAIGIVEQRVGQAGPDDLVIAPTLGMLLAVVLALLGLGAAAKPAWALTTPSASEPESMLSGLGLHGGSGTAMLVVGVGHLIGEIISLIGADLIFCRT